MKTLYHYTDAASADAIMKSCKIKASTFENNNYDVAYGEGVYFTDMDPSGKSDLFQQWSSTFFKQFAHNTVALVIGCPQASEQICTSVVVAQVATKRSLRTTGQNGRTPLKMESWTAP